NCSRRCWNSSFGSPRTQPLPAPRPHSSRHPVNQQVHHRKRPQQHRQHEPPCVSGRPHPNQPQLVQGKKHEVPDYEIDRDQCDECLRQHDHPPSSLEPATSSLFTAFFRPLVSCPPCPQALVARRSRCRNASCATLLDRNGLREVAGLVHVRTTLHRHVVSQQLPRYRPEDRRKQPDGLGNSEPVVHELAQCFVVITRDGDNAPLACLYLLHVRHDLLEYRVVRRDEHHRHELVDESD